MLELAKAPAPQVVELPDASQRQSLGSPLFNGPLSLVRNVKVKLALSLGSTSMTVSELAALKDGSVLKLDKLLDDDVELVLDGQTVARGRLVAVDDHFGISITELAPLPKP